MPVLDGYGAKEGIRRLSPEVPVIAVTAYAFASDEQKILAAGFDGYIAKPINPSILFGKIRELLAERLHRPVLDSDAYVVETAGMSIPDIFAAGGEDAFRARETAALAALGKGSGAVLATGGGSICREENYPLLHQNGTIFWLQRDLALLPKDGRPISQRSDLTALYAQRAPLYARFADAVIDNNGTAEETVRQILEVLA